MDLGGEAGGCPVTVQSMYIAPIVLPKSVKTCIIRWSRSYFVSIFTEIQVNISIFSVW